MAKNKKPIKTMRKYLHLSSFGLSAVAFCLVFFELTLTMHGGWDDLSLLIIVLAPIIAILSVIIAVLNVTKYRAKKCELLPAISVVGISLLFFWYVMIFSSATLIAKI